MEKALRMEARKKYEEEILQKVHHLPDEQLSKVVSLLDKLAAEESKKKDQLAAINELRGAFKEQLSSTEEFMLRKREEKKLDR